MRFYHLWRSWPPLVSTLVLMDSWINAIGRNYRIDINGCFNPCFNGFMDKCLAAGSASRLCAFCFNPCFNGFMDKCVGGWLRVTSMRLRFNPCFNGFMDKCHLMPLLKLVEIDRFNPCFNGFMDKCALAGLKLAGIDEFQPLF